MTTALRARLTAIRMWRALPNSIGEDLDDLVSEATLGALQAPYVEAEFIAARRAIIQYLRRQYPGSRSGKPFRYAPLKDTFTVAPDQERLAISAEERERILRAVDLLPAEELAVIRAEFFEGLDHAAISERMGRSRSAVSRLKMKAFSRLRKLAA